MFTQGDIYKRSTIHDKYGGSRQSGIANCKNFPFIFIFSGENGHKHGYKDGWKDNYFTYTGEGQIGHMTFVRGNKALRDHKENRKRVFLFTSISEKKTPYVKFERELILERYEDFETFDNENKMRNAIRFIFSEVDDSYNVNDNKTLKDPQPNYSNKNDKGYEKRTLVTTRVGQGRYRQKILERWGFKCAVTHYSDPRILIASHILPWKESSEQEKLDVDNGILLSPVYDALFDKNMISFTDQGTIILSSKMKKPEYKKLGVSGKEKIKGLSEGNKYYLSKHREKLL